ncbi:NADH-quinone oxidoreductase subunit N [Buchnera aphidicola]|uniref:NADH-quinone oxidoreductase subunit N n=1 Tax=Buchnera aphidicola TaxID=9 RepID=UPI003464A22B
MNLILENIFFIAPVLILGISIILNLLIIIIQRNFVLSFLVTIFGLICSLFFFSYFMRNTIIDAIYFLYFDNTSFYYVILFFCSSVFTCFFSYLWLREKNVNKEEFNLLLLISNIGGYLLFLSDDIFTFFIGIELLSLPLLGMMGYFSFRKYSNLVSTFKYFIISSISSIFLLLGLSFIYLFFGSVNLFILKSSDFINIPDNTHLIFLFGIAFLFISFFVKLAVFPFHCWIADIYSEVPLIVLTYYANAVKIVLFFVFLKIYMTFSSFHIAFFSSLLECVIFCSIIFGSLLSLFQKNFKKFLGYSSIVHSGYLMIPLLFFYDENFSQIIEIYLLGYILNSTVLFSSIYLISCFLDKNKNYSLKNYEGIFWKSPILTFSIIISSFSMIGIPLTIGFLSKFFLLKILIIRKNINLIFSLFFGSIISLYYYFNFIKLFFYKNKFKNFENSYVQTKLFIFCKIFVFLLSLMIIFFGCNLDILNVKVL